MRVEGQQDGAGEPRLQTPSTAPLHNPEPACCLLILLSLCPPQWSDQPTQGDKVTLRPSPLPFSSCTKILLQHLPFLLPVDAATVGCPGLVWQGVWLRGARKAHQLRRHTNQSD